jgi:putative phage-type endonuclease
MIEQGTEEWHQQRLGKVTASNLHKVLAKTKTGYGADRAHYMTQLVLERITGTTRAENYTNAAMQWGIEQEPFARAAYEAYKGVMVEEVGFMLHPTIEMAGASPDGLVGPDGMVEIKCPESATFLEALLSQTVAGKYYAQMQWQMRCAGRQWCDYVVYDSRFPQKLQLVIIRVNADDEWLKNAETEVIKFLAEVNEKVQALKQRMDV